MVLDFRLYCIALCLYLTCSVIYLSYSNYLFQGISYLKLNLLNLRPDMKMVCLVLWFEENV